MSFDDLWSSLRPIGREGGVRGYRRFAWTDADLACRAWFRDQANARGLPVTADRNGNLWAWWGEPAPEAIATGSHLDSVPGGGAFDGPLGVVSALAAIDVLRERGVRARRPLAVVAFSEEEGARFGVACLGSRLLAGAVDPDQARRLTDDDGVTLAEAMTRAGHDPAALGRDDEALSRIAAFVELHIEQGRGLVREQAAVGLASAIWPHGRWRFEFIGEANHAGTTLLTDRRDPVLTLAETALAARECADRENALATIGRLCVEPNGVNAIPSALSAWLDARAPDDQSLTALVESVERQARKAGLEQRVAVTVHRESHTPGVGFDRALRTRIRKVLGGVPELPTAAGHDAGILAARVPSAMIFVRNPTGVSHSPDEHADVEDCLAGVRALADVLEDLLAGDPI